MAILTKNVIDILHTYNIFPDETECDLPDIGEIKKDEMVYSTSIGKVFREDTEREIGVFNLDDPRIREWWQKIERIIDGERQTRGGLIRPIATYPPEPHCAWYCPIHFFGHGWGIFIRENCILQLTADIAQFVIWSTVTRIPPPSIATQLLRSAFYVLFLHEQFHHKVESFGFRLLIATGSDRYKPYKKKVYRKNYLTPYCLEEALANAESYRRLSEPRYVQRIDKGIRDGLRKFLKHSFRNQPPGYKEGIRFLSEPGYRDALYKLQSQIRDVTLVPVTPAAHWTVAPNMITSLTDITDNIYVVLPHGSRPIFKPTSVDPRVTVSSKKLISALVRHHGYQEVSGGKGSHVKLSKPGAPTIVIPGNKPVLSPGVVKHALKAIGAHSISWLPDLLAGQLPSNT